MAINPGWIMGGQVLGGVMGARSARKAEHQQQRGIQQGLIALQGGEDRALAYLNAGLDQSLTMNRPYSDVGIGAMANINAMLGLPTSQGTSSEDLTRLQGDMDRLRARREDIDKEREEIEKLLKGTGGWNAKSYRMGGKYKGMHRDQLQNRLESLKNKSKAIKVQFSGMERNFREATRQNELMQSANQKTQENGVSAIRPFSMDADSVGESDAYRFRMEQGMEAVNRSMAARGGLGSGNRLIGLTEYAQGLASTEFENEFQRQLTSWRSQFDVLNANLAAAGIGQRATEGNIGLVTGHANNSANVVQGPAANVANLYGQQGAAQAAGTLGANNALQQGVGQMAYMAGQNNWFGGGNNNNNQVDVSDLPEIEMDYTGP